MHSNGISSYLFANGLEIYKFKAIDCEINADILCLGNGSNNCSVYNIEKIGLYGYIYDVSLDYNSIDVADVLDIYKSIKWKNKI